MLIHFLTNLTEALRRENIYVTPGQICDAVQYILTSKTVTPDGGLPDSLYPIFISRREEKNAYYRAWKNLWKDTDSPHKRQELFQFLQKKEFQISSKKSTCDKSSQWAPWLIYQKYPNRVTKNEYEHAIMESLAHDQNLANWEKAMDEELAKQFIQKKDNTELLQKAMLFRKEFSRIKRDWNKVMRPVSSGIKKKEDKIGPRKSERPFFQEGHRANLDRWGDPELLNSHIETISEQQVKKLQEPIREIAERLKTRLQNKKRIGAGKIDLRRTLRICFRTFGEPIRIIYTRRKKKTCSMDHLM